MGDTQKESYWVLGCPVRTAWMDSLSSLFPAWEELWATVVEAYLPDVADPALKARMHEFIAQERAHKHAHHAHNKRLGWALDVEAREVAQVARAMARPKMRIWLSAMVSIEHIASSLSRYFLTNLAPQLQGRSSALFRWHSVEELQHKSLAIDLWDYLGYSRTDICKHAMRNLYYVLRHCMASTVVVLRTEGLLKHPRIWLKLVVVAGILVRHVGIPHLQLLRDSFHPSHTDDTELILRYA